MGNCISADGVAARGRVECVPVMLAAPGADSGEAELPHRGLTLGCGGFGVVSLQRVRVRRTGMRTHLYCQSWQPSPTESMMRCKSRPAGLSGEGLLSAAPALTKHSTLRQRAPEHRARPSRRRHPIAGASDTPCQILMSRARCVELVKSPAIP
jgi:hypothetical protein